MDKSFGEVFREFRVSLGISLRSLASEADMDPAYLSRLENGKTGVPKNETVQRLFQAFCELQGLDQQECDGVTRQLMVAAGHLQNREELIDDLTERFRSRLGEAGLSEGLIEEALTKVSLATMRSVLLDQEPIEIGLQGQYSMAEIRQREKQGEQVEGLSSAFYPGKKQSIENTASYDSALEYLSQHANSFGVQAKVGRKSKRKAHGVQKESEKVISAGNDAEIRIRGPVNKQQQQQLRLIAKLINLIMEK